MVTKLQIFYGIKIPNVDSNHTCLAVISLDSILKKKLLSASFLKDGKYIEKKVIRHNNGNLSNFSFSDESDKN